MPSAIFLFCSSYCSHSSDIQIFIAYLNISICFTILLGACMEHRAKKIKYYLLNWRACMRCGPPRAQLTSQDTQHNYWSGYRHIPRDNHRRYIGQSGLTFLHFYSLLHLVCKNILREKVVWHRQNLAGFPCTQPSIVSTQSFSARPRKDLQ